MAHRLIAAAAAALTLAACGGGDDPAPVKETAKASGRAIGTGAAPAAKKSLLGDEGVTA